MCGICGQYDFESRKPVDPDVIKTMTNTLAHRGPDDEGFFIDGSLGFGFRRLSIIDLDGGHQPMCDQQKSVWMVFNGEIYNFPELREELEGFGHVFRTKCDTEVIIHGYKQWGTEVFNHLNGMFGLAIWDVLEKKLIIARDAMGIKLVYYKIEDGCLFFGSEIRAIHAGQKLRQPNVDPIALNLFLRYRYTPSPKTLYQDVKKLAPGTMLVINGDNPIVERWYRYKPEPFSPMPTVEEAKEELLGIYNRAVKRHLLSDVPVGILLSGGIDSGLLLGMMNQFGNCWPAFTVGYGDSFKQDELRDAAETAKIYNAKFTPVQLNIKRFESSLPKIVSFLEEPVATSSIVPMYFVCERARQDVKVALIGQGPDELFGGYLRHLGVHYGKAWRYLPDFLKDSLSTVINAVPRRETLKRGVYSLNISGRLSRYQHVFSIMPADIIDNLFKTDILPQGTGDIVLNYWADFEDLMEFTDELGGFQFLEMRSSLPDELLMFADKMSMAHSLEVRVPYLDREIIEYVEKLNSNFKVRNGIRKWLHRRVCKQFLPKKIIKRKKRGFAVNVVDDWFHNSLSKNFEGYLKDPSSFMFEYLRYEKINKLLEDHKSGKNDNHKLLFSLIVYEEWLRAIT